MKQKHILKWLGIAPGVYLLYGVLTAILVPLSQKEATGELWSQYEARLSEDASQERVRSIEDTDSALLWRLQLIESAEREVIFSTFDLRADGSGQDLMAALYGAAQRGVRVRVIVDGLNGFLHLQNSGVLRALAAEENVEVRFYDPIDLLRPWKLNYRLHDKYLIADGSKYILGGRNSNDLFLGSYQENQNIDRDVLVVSDGGEGSSVSQLLTYFESVWSQPEKQTITGKASSQTDALQERYAALCAVHGKELAAVVQGEAALVDVLYALLPQRGIDLLALDDEHQLRVEICAAHVGVERADDAQIIPDQNRLRVQRLAADDLVHVDAAR